MDNFESQLNDLVGEWLDREGYESIISALELTIMALKEEEKNKEEGEFK